MWPLSAQHCIRRVESICIYIREEVVDEYHYEHTAVRNVPGIRVVRRLIGAIPNAQVGRLRTTYCVREMEIFELEMHEMEMNEIELEMVLAMS